MSVPPKDRHLIATSETSDLAVQMTPGRQASQRELMTDTLSPGHDTAVTASGTPVPGDLGRYALLGELGRGGMGQVLAVHDEQLERELAMKVLLPDETSSDAVARFLGEAKITAQLQHPGVVPVHELGHLDSGQAYFTMQVVRGRTLRHLVEAYHAADHADATARLYRLVSIFNQVCETIAYAHRHGIVHRDLKPENVMVGEFGEVRVLDWGLAKRIDAAPEPPGLELNELNEPTVRTRPPSPRSRPSQSGSQTLAGEVMGTPVYMSPEQARGQNAAVNRASDVYALAAVLFHLLTGTPPFSGTHAMAIMMRVVGGLRNPLEGRHPIPRALRELCDRGMAVRPEGRPADASVFQRSVEAWLSGAQRRERALQLVDEAQALEAELSAERARVQAHESQVDVLRRASAAAPTDEPALMAVWSAEDALEQARLSVERVLVSREQRLHAALGQSPDAAEARTALARHYQAAHASAEAAHDAAALLRFEALLREQAEALPPIHPDRSAYFEYLAGEGSLALSTSPEGASVEWRRYERHGRRLVPVLERALRPTPIKRAWLPCGSHLLILRCEGRETVRYPVRMDRLGRWQGAGTAHGGGAGTAHGDGAGTAHGDGAGTAHGDGAGTAHGASAVPLPELGTLGPDDVYVPPGTALFGGDPSATDALPRSERFVEAFVMRRDPVTNAEYLAFLNDLAAQGRADEAVRLAPTVTGAARFTWRADLPVVLVDQACALAYARWLAERTGLPWRLPTELEWEKAARGVDGRAHPWGDEYHAAWANLRDRDPTRPELLPVGSCPVDESPYGVRGLAGNVRDWVSDEAPGPGGQVRGLLKGGAYGDVAMAGRCASRLGVGRDHRDLMTGFRLARSL